MARRTLSSIIVAAFVVCGMCILVAGALFFEAAREHQRMMAEGAAGWGAVFYFTLPEGGHSGD